MDIGLAAASGLSATMLLTHLLKSGEHILCVDDVYGGIINNYIVIRMRARIFQVKYNFLFVEDVVLFVVGVV